ncbi:MAG: TIM barrel protein [Planctomycetota bacterium]
MNSPAAHWPVHVLGAPTEELGFVDGNPLLDADWQLPPSSLVVAWSGSVSEASLFQRDPHTWMSAGREAFDDFLRRIAPELTAREQRLLLRPHARHVLCDPQRCLSFLRELDEDAPFGIALDAGAMLEDEMLSKVEDHLERAFEALGRRVHVVVATDVARSSGDDPLRPVPIGQGVLPVSLMGSLIRAHVPPTTPIVLLPEDPDQQVAALGLHG